MKRFAQWLLAVVVIIFVLTEIFIEESPASGTSSGADASVSEDLKSVSKTAVDESVFVETEVENYDPAEMVVSLKNNLSLWEPAELSYKNSIVTIVSKEKRVTSQIYRAMIHAACGSAWSDSDLWEGSFIKEIRVINKFERQGMVFEGGLPECMRLGELSGDESRLYISGVTHLY